MVSSAGDRRALYGALIFGGVILACFVFALILLASGKRGGASGDGPRIGVVELIGPIHGTKQVVAALRDFHQDKAIKAVVLRVDTPGGAVGPSQEVYREVERIREDKPVVASFGSLAASGGYYAAAAASKIVANAGTITGSIGVISVTTNVQELLALARVHVSTFKTGKFKDTMSPLREMTDEERAYVQRLIDAILAQFVGDVARGRKLDRAKVKAVADGRVFTGAEAKQLGLVDQLGNFSDALELAAKLAKTKGDPVPVYPQKPGGLLERVLMESASSAGRVLTDSLVPQQRVEARHPSLR